MAGNSIQSRTRQDGGSAEAVRSRSLGTAQLSTDQHKIARRNLPRLPRCCFPGRPKRIGTPHSEKTACPGVKAHHNVSRGPRLGRVDPRFPLGAPRNNRGEIDHSDSSGAISGLG